MVKASWSAVNDVATMLLNRTVATSEHRAAETGRLLQCI